MLRFPNPGSDFPRFVRTFKIIYARVESEGVAEFDLDFAVRALIDAGQVSSSGAVGNEALARSTRTDRSRDPLYNQLKMYSELYRMLGWILPGESRLTFRISLLGDYINDAPEPFDSRYQGLFRELLVSITFPNPNTANLGVTNLRPFYRLLQLANRVDGFICRDELIVALLPMKNDLAAGALDDAVAKIDAMRGSGRRLKSSVKRVASEAGVQVNTLQNYTRFPLGVLKSPITGWAEAARLRGPYGKSMQFYQLTEFGRAYADRLDSMHDVRWQQLTPYPKNVTAHFMNLCFYGMLDRCGFNINEVAGYLSSARLEAEPIFAGLGIGVVEDVLFSPIQEAPHAMIHLAASVEP